MDFISLYRNLCSMYIFLQKDIFFTTYMCVHVMQFLLQFSFYSLNLLRESDITDEIKYAYFFVIIIAVCVMDKEWISRPVRRETTNGEFLSISRPIFIGYDAYALTYRP